MTSMPNPTCPLCGLRFASKPLLELHIRDDHRPRRREQATHGDASGIPSSSAAASPSVRSSLASRPSRTVKEVTAMTAARRPRPGQAMTVLRPVIRALRHVNDELTRTSEAIICSARVPQSRPHVQTPAARDPRPHAIKEPADRAA